MTSTASAVCLVVTTVCCALCVATMLQRQSDDARV